MTIAPHNPSPFDSIRQTRPDGSEFWSARDLMPLLDYEKWERFADSIERAKASAASQSLLVEDHFPGAGKMVEVGSGARREVADCHLTRFACYLVAMNGDPRKPAVAAAQAYFAVKTREAEVAPKVHPELVTRADLARMVLAAEEELAITQQALSNAAPAIAYHERYVANGDAATIKDWAAQFGLTQPQAFALLLEKNVIYKKSLGDRWSQRQQKVVAEHEYRARAGRVTFAFFDLRPQHNAPRHHNGQVRQTLYVRQEHALDLGRRVGISPVQIDKAV